MTLGERLRAQREHLGLSQASMAELGGVKRNAQAQFEQDVHLPGGGYLLGVHKAGVDIGFVLLGEGFKLDKSSQSKNNDEISIKTKRYSNLNPKNELEPFGSSSGAELGPELPWDQFVQVPRWNVFASMGPGAEQYEPQIVETLAFKASFLRQLGIAPAHASIITGVGNSMSPTIAHNDLLIVDNAVRSYETKGVYVLAEDHRLVAKRLERERKTGDFLVISDNATEFPLRRVSAAQTASIHIMGRVKRAWSSRPL